MLVDRLSYHSSPLRATCDKEMPEAPRPRACPAAQSLVSQAVALDSTCSRRNLTAETTWETTDFG